MKQKKTWMDRLLIWLFLRISDLLTERWCNNGEHVLPKFSQTLSRPLRQEPACRVCWRKKNDTFNVVQL